MTARAPTKASEWPALFGVDPAVLLDALSGALFDNNHDLVWDLTPDGRVERVNERLSVMLGIDADAVAGRSFLDLVAPDGAAVARATFEAAVGGASGTCVCHLMHRDGRRVAMRATVVPLVIAGRVVRVYASCHDVTAEMAAVAALAEREALYSLIVEQSPECVTILQDGRIAYANPAADRLRGVGEGALVGRSWTAHTHPDDVDRVVALFTEVLHAPPGTTCPYEKRLVTVAGQVVDVEGTATAIAYQGRPAVHSFMRDVTERRRADGERLRAQRLEALGRLAASVAHDFNNLLAVMLSAVELAAEAVAPGDPLREDLAAAAGAARRGRTLTRQLLTFARREPTQPRAIDLNQLTVGMQPLLQRLAGPRVQLELALEPEPACVVCDPTQAEQVLLNLVANARDAIDDGGRIRIETAPIDGTVRLTVRDDGAGISPEVRRQLFEPFFTTKADGTGLGLATVYGVVTGAGGRVEVESEPGQGAAFHLLLPRAPEGVA